MEGEALKAGKARVQTVLIDALNARGMKRRSGLTVEQFQAECDGLAARLAYMSEGNLIVLGEMIARMATGKGRNVWPAEITITNWARGLEEPPASESRLVRSYLQSNAGARAKAEGYLVELFEYLKKYGMPPTNDYAAGMIRADGAKRARERALITERIERGTATPEERDWLRRYGKALARCETIINNKSEAAA